MGVDIDILNDFSELNGRNYAAAQYSAAPDIEGLAKVVGAMTALGLFAPEISQRIGDVPTYIKNDPNLQAVTLKACLMANAALSAMLGYYRMLEKQDMTSIKNLVSHVRQHATRQ